ncbi:MAG: hypothetical protein DMG57_25425 [Acidobacteria bacterium]|nr:MAG: hypothetical protein DMG57_25425 [Acidobacteriota bacterium]
MLSLLTARPAYAQVGAAAGSDPIPVAESRFRTLPSASVEQRAKNPPADRVSRQANYAVVPAFPHQIENCSTYLVERRDLRLINPPSYLVFGRTSL